MRRRPLFLLVLVAVASLVLVACGKDHKESDSHAKNEAIKSGKKFAEDAYIPAYGNTEQRNYNKAQEIYNDPTTILWCSVMPEASTTPIITVPIKGKLTSSSTTAFRPEEAWDVRDDDLPTEKGIARSVDGLFHPSPPPYRYGFTPGDQLVDFTDVGTICTTQPLEFQRQSIEVKPAEDVSKASKEAEAALEAHDGAKAQRILEGAVAE